MNAAPAPVPVSSRQARWRVALLVAVLAGFFLMHGLSAGDSCAWGSGSVAAAAENTSTSAVMQAAGTVAVSAVPAATGVAVSQACGCQDSMGAMCVPSRAPDGAALLAMLLAGFVVMPLGGTPLGGLSRSARSGAGRWSRARVPVRALVCVSRT